MDKIAMIREVKNLMGCGLREAKETVEMLSTSRKDRKY